MYSEVILVLLNVRTYGTVMSKFAYSNQVYSSVNNLNKCIQKIREKVLKLFEKKMASGLDRPKNIIFDLECLSDKRNFQTFL